MMDKKFIAKKIVKEVGQVALDRENPKPRANRTENFTDARSRDISTDLRPPPANLLRSLRSSMTLIRTLRFRGGWARSLDFTPDGKRLVHCVSQGKYFPLRIWDVGTGKLAKVIRGHKDMMYAVRYDPRYYSHTVHPRYIASGDIDGVLFTWNGWTGKRIGKRTLDGRVYSVCMDVRKPPLLAVATGKAVIVTKATDVYKTQFRRGWSALSVALDNTFLVVGLANRDIKVVDRGSWKTLDTIKFDWPFPPGQIIIFGPYLAVCQGGWGKSGNDFPIEIYTFTGHVAGKELRHTLLGHHACVSEIAYWRYSGLLVSGSEDETIKIWDVRRGIRLLTYANFSGPVTSVAIHGNTIAAGSWEEIKILRFKR